jgi:hypothetical protein
MIGTVAAVDCISIALTRLASLIKLALVGDEPKEHAVTIDH